MFNDVELTFSNVELVFSDVEHKFSIAEHNFYLGPGILRACKMRKVCYLCHLFVFMKTLTIFTPTYNRAHTLGRV